MFKRFLSRRILPTTIALLSISLGKPAFAALFDQTDVDQERFIAIAVHLPQANRYNLLILEQKSDSRPCWQVLDDSGGTIDPLLLDFDFTGICGRSTDSNGYSIRQVGEDLALKYRLSLVKKGNKLALMGLPIQARYGRPIEIGRTQSGNGEFLKINLNPDWKFTQRSYQGKTLGHIYLTRDVLPTELEDVEVSEENLNTSTISASKTSSATKKTNVAENKTLSPSSNSSNNNKPLVENSAPKQKTIMTKGEPDTSHLGAAPNPSTQIIKPLEGPVQIPVPFPSPQKNRSQSNPTQNQGPAQSLPVLSPQSSTKSKTNQAPVAVIPVMTIAPLGRFGSSDSDVFSTRDLAQLPPGTGSTSDSPPPPPVSSALSFKRYRVLVARNQAVTTTDVKAVVPDAFWSTIKGRRALQVGSFENKAKAELLLQELSNRGIKGMIDTVQY